MVDQQYVRSIHLNTGSGAVNSVGIASLEESGYHSVWQPEHKNTGLIGNLHMYPFCHFKALIGFEILSRIFYVAVYRQDKLDDIDSIDFL